MQQVQTYHYLQPVVMSLQYEMAPMHCAPEARISLQALGKHRAKQKICRRLGALGNDRRLRLASDSEDARRPSRQDDRDRCKRRRPHSSTKHVLVTDVLSAKPEIQYEHACKRARIEAAIVSDPSTSGRCSIINDTRAIVGVVVLACLAVIIP